MVTNTAAIKSLLQPGLDAIFGDYNDIPAQWSELFEKHTSDKYKEEDVEIKMLALAQLRSEGAATVYNDMGERYKYVYIHRGVGLGFVLTRTSLKDNLYKTKFGPNTRALKRSFMQTKEVYGAAVLNNGFDSTNFPGGDGVSLFSTSHPSDGGSLTNTPVVQAELQETSLQDGIIGVRRFKDAAGLRVLVMPKKLIVATELQFTAERLLKTELRVGVGDNDLNALRNMNVLPESYRVNDFLTNVKGWFVLTDCPDGLKYFEREALETDMYTDFDTDNLKVKGYERYSFGWSNWRAAWGANPT